jgi:hypothetical protein
MRRSRYRSKILPLALFTVLLLSFTSLASSLSCDSGGLDSQCNITNSHDVTAESINGSGDLLIKSGGQLTTSSGPNTIAEIDLDGNITVQNGELNGNFNISAKNLELESGQYIDSNFKGYAGGSSGGGDGNGPGGGVGLATQGSSYDAGGAGYGGKGADGNSDAGGTGGSNYGDRKKPSS